MTEFEFRLRFNFRGGDTINHEAEEVLLLQDEAGRRLRLKSGQSGVPIKEKSRAALIGGLYQSEQEAREAAMRAKRALLVWAVSQRFGVDLGDGKLRGGLTVYGLEMLEKQFGKPVRNDVHGIDVYPRQEGLLFAATDLKAALAKDPTAFVETVASQFLEPLPLTDKQTVSAELFCSSFFDVPLRSRLITLVSAVEALLEPPERSLAVVAVVELLEKTVRDSELDDGNKMAMLGSLQGLRRDSIGQAGRSLCESLLPGKEYLGRTASRFFSLCYDLRSQILHDGRLQDAAIDLLEVVNACQGFVADLLLAAFNVASPQPTRGTDTRGAA